MRKFLRIIWQIIIAPFRLIRWLVRFIFRWFKQIISDVVDLFTTEVEDEPLPETFSKTMENPMGLLEHINALRKNLFRAVIFLFFTTVVSFAYTPQIIDYLAKPVGGINALRAIDVTEPVGVFMRIALLTGFTFSLPYIVFELWLFIAPGLKKKSRLGSLLSIPIAAILFYGGMAFAFYFMLPVGIPFLINTLGMPAELRPSSYVRFVTSVMFWIGIAFQFPLFVYVLASIGILKAKFLKEQWRLAIVLIAILSASITPTIDPVNMGIVMGPMVLLYFLSIGLAYMAQRGRG